MGAYGPNYGASYAGIAITEPIISPSTKTVTASLCVTPSINNNLCTNNDVKEVFYYM